MCELRNQFQVNVFGAVAMRVAMRIGIFCRQSDRLPSGPAQRGHRPPPDAR
jgi:hypothetical protein